jgi:hypothetical protein
MTQDLEELPHEWLRPFIMKAPNEPSLPAGHQAHESSYYLHLFMTVGTNQWLHLVNQLDEPAPMTKAFQG